MKHPEGYGSPRLTVLKKNNIYLIILIDYLYLQKNGGEL